VRSGTTGEEASSTAFPFPFSSGEEGVPGTTGGEEEELEGGGGRENGEVRSSVIRKDVRNEVMEETKEGVVSSCRAM
jgi:hypothetical protein